MKSAPACSRFLFLDTEDKRSSDYPRFSSVLFLIFLVVWGSFAFFFDLGTMAVWSDNEGQRVVPPLEMLASGEYAIPKINGVDYLTKPPLLYWMVALSYKIFGEANEFSARVPTATCALILIVSLYLFSRKAADEGSARWAALLLLGCPYLIERSRWTEIDVPFTTALFLTVSLLWVAHEASETWKTAIFAILSGTFFAMALLLKGPPAILFLITAMFAIWLTKGKLSERHLRFAIWGTCAAGGLALISWIIAIRFPLPLLLLVITWGSVTVAAIPKVQLTRSIRLLLLCVVVSCIWVTPWLVALLRQRDLSYLLSLLHTEALERTYLASEINSGSPLYYFAGILGMAAPWSFVLPLLTFPLPVRRPFSSFSWAHSCLAIGCFSCIAGKEYEYILPIFPFLAVATGFRIHALLSSEIKWWQPTYLYVWSWASTVVICVGIVALVFYFSLTLFSVSLASKFLVLMAAACIGVSLTSRGFPYRIIATCALTTVLVLVVLVARGYDSLKPERSPKLLGLACRELLDQGLPLETAQRLGSTQPFPYPALAFYMRHKISFENSPEKVIEKLRSHKPYYYLLHERMLQDVMFTAYRDVFDLQLGPFDRKGLVVIGNSTLPETPAITEARKSVQANTYTVK